MESKIFAIDFDGTLCENAFPEIGAPIENTIMFVRLLKATGHKLILWTCRSGQNLENAVEWCRERGLEFDTVNEQLPEILDLFEKDTRKIFADYYLDDKNIPMDDCSIYLKEHADKLEWIAIAKSLKNECIRLSKRVSE